LSDGVVSLVAIRVLKVGFSFFSKAVGLPIEVLARRLVSCLRDSLGISSSHRKRRIPAHSHIASLVRNWKGLRSRIGFHEVGCNSALEFNRLSSGKLFPVTASLFILEVQLWNRWQELTGNHDE